MLSPRSFAVAIILATIPVCLSAQPPVDSPPAFFVHHKQASSEQGLDQKYGSSVALTNGVLVAADENEHVEILRQRLMALGLLRRPFRHLRPASLLAHERLWPPMGIGLQ